MMLPGTPISDAKLQVYWFAVLAFPFRMKVFTVCCYISEICNLCFIVT